MSLRTTIRLPEDLLRRAKHKAAAEGRTLTELIERGLRQELKEPHKQMRRVRPPVSSAAGGLMPGIDLNDSAALQEMDDLERLRRVR